VCPKFSLKQEKKTESIHTDMTGRTTRYPYHFLQILILSLALVTTETAPIHAYDTVSNKIGGGIISEVESLLNENPGAVIVEGCEVGPDSTHRGDIMVVGAPLAVSGKVIGNVYVVDGDLTLRGESEVVGRIVVLGGKTFSSRLARIGTELEVYDFRLTVKKRGDKFLLIREEGKGEGHVNLELRGIKGFGVGPYNRVDGLPLLFHARLNDGSREERWNLTTKGIYRIAAHRWGWDVLWEYNRVWKFTRVGVGYSSKTMTNDRYRVSDFENSVAAILFKEDFRNYYEKRALEMWFELPAFESVSIGCEFETAEYFSMEQMADFSLFGWGKEFRVNPAVEEGRANSVTLFITQDTRDNEESPEYGWYSKVALERAGDPFGGDFTFTRFEADVRRYNRIGYNAHLDLRFFFHYGRDPLPELRKLSFGGVGGLRGYPDSLPGGDRIVLGSVDFRYLLFDELKHSIFFRDDMNLVLFFDVGEAKTGPEEFHAGDLKADAGVGVSGTGLLSYFGVFLGKSLTDSELEPRVTVRVSRDF
jgi:hypothetical protein